MTLTDARLSLINIANTHSPIIVRLNWNMVHPAVRGAALKEGTLTPEPEKSGETCNVLPV